MERNTAERASFAIANGEHGSEIAAPRLKKKAEDPLSKLYFPLSGNNHLENNSLTTF
jgi:hypothetical protein